MFILTNEGRLKTRTFLNECAAKRQEILDAKLDTNETVSESWTLADVELAVNQLANDSEQGVYEEKWNVTDSYESDTALRLVEGLDYVDVTLLSHIRWDTDGVDSSELDLPEILCVITEDLKGRNIADYLSDCFGFCVLEYKEESAA